MNRTTTVGGIHNSFPVMPGAGIAKTKADVIKLLMNEDITIIVFGSITIEPRSGNAGNQMFNDPGRKFTINSVGMTNLGKEKYETVLKEIAELVHIKKRKLVISIAAVASHEEYTELLKFCIECGADGVEFNFGCPNVTDGGSHHAIPSFDPKNLKEILDHVDEHFDGLVPIPIWIKISPLIEDNELVRTISTESSEELSCKINEVLAAKVCELLNRYDYIKAVVCANTIGNVCVLHEGIPVIGPNPNNPKNIGGLSGGLVHKLNVLQTAFLRKLLSKKIDLIGAGGVRTGKDMSDFIQAGAVAVQATSIYWEKDGDPGVWSNICFGYATQE